MSKKKAAAAATNPNGPRLFDDPSKTQIALVLADSDAVKEEGNNTFGVFIGGTRHVIRTEENLKQLVPDFLHFREAGLGRHAVAINPDRISAIKHDGGDNFGVFVGGVRHAVQAKGATLEQLANGEVPDLEETEAAS